MENEVRDVIVLGGGLAGLTLALQLRQRDPDIDVLVVERNEHPPPVAAFKVGESTVESGAYYFSDVLGLKPYILKEQLRKSGLRYFFSDGKNTDIANRVELGNRGVLPYPTYQLDRGTWEDRLAKEATKAGAEFVDKCKVKDVTLAEGEDLHTVLLVRDGEESELQCKWVVDATGRFQMFKRKLGLAKDAPHKCNASWWRIPSKIDIDDWSDNQEWLDRVEEYQFSEDEDPAPLRYLATNHLLGHGWWFWIIPLANDYTSLGLVVDDRLFPISEINTLEKSMDWLKEHEPQAYEKLLPHMDDVLDFKFLRHYSHSCERVFSPDRWAITGVAGTFHDPLFSVGSDIIAWSNTIVTDLILKDRAGQDIRSRIDLYDSIFLDQYVGPMFQLYKDKYLVMGNPQVFSTYVHWSTCWYWGILANMIIHDKITEFDVLAQLDEEMKRAIRLWHRMEEFFVEWFHALGPDTGQSDHLVGIFNETWINRLMAELKEEMSDETFVQKVRENLANLEHLTAHVFWIAVESAIEDPPERQPINPYAVSMDPSRWEADGLFDSDKFPAPPADPIDPEAEMYEYENRWFDENRAGKAGQAAAASG